MKIIVLGGHGFVGRNVAQELKGTENQVYQMSRQDGLDLRDYNKTKKYFKKIMPDIIINAAAKVGSLNYVTENAALVFDNNMRMLLNMYKATNDIVPKAIIINPVANCAYPGEKELYSESNFLNGPAHQSVFAYGNTRRMMVVLSEVYKMQYGFRTINFFVPNMYGPYDSTDPNKAHALNALISKVVKAKHKGLNQMKVWGSGVAIREWLFAPDCAKVFMETIERIDEIGWEEPINIGQNFGLSIRELVNIIIEEVDFIGEILWDRSMPDGAPKKVMDDRRFRKQFPKFKFTNLRDGIHKTIKYYESIYPY